MDFLNYLKKYDAQKKIDKLAKKYKNKRVVIFGAEQFAKIVFENFDMTKLNIVGVADKKFEQEGEHNFFNLNCIKPNDLKEMDYDVILIANFDYKKFSSILDKNILYGTKNDAVEIRPLINLEFMDLFKK